MTIEKLEARKKELQAQQQQYIAQQQQCVANANACAGAVQDIDYWLQQLLEAQPHPELVPEPVQKKK